MNQVPIPPDWLPEGAELSDSGMSYTDALEVPVVNAQPDNGQGIPRLAIPRHSTLYELAPDEARRMAGTGWRLWLRMTVAAGNINLALEPATPPADTYPWLDSSVPDQPEAP